MPMDSSRRLSPAPEPFLMVQRSIEKVAGDVNPARFPHLYHRYSTVYSRSIRPYPHATINSSCARYSLSTIRPQSHSIPCRMTPIEGDPRCYSFHCQDERHSRLAYRWSIPACQPVSAHVVQKRSSFRCEGNWGYTWQVSFQRRFPSGSRYVIFQGLPLLGNQISEPVAFEGGGVGPTSPR
jgi:hypothetical protein